MPKMNMVISNGNQSQMLSYPSKIITSTPVPKQPTALNAPLIARIQGVRPGCGSCGR